MSMPNTLFDDSEKSAVTCVMIFEAHKPHNDSKKTWFGYWKEDGFKKKRPYGRIDYYGAFHNEIREYWLDSYFSKKEIKGFSVLRHVGHEDEWLVEPYLQTEFEELRDNDFVETIKDYTTFLYRNGLVVKVSSESSNNKKLAIDFSKWKPVKLGWSDQNTSGLFEVIGSKTTSVRVLDKDNVSGDRKYPFITTQATNNGVRDWYNIFTDEGNILTIDSAVVGFCAYQPLNFTASDHVEKLIPKFDLNVFKGMFLSTLINLEGKKISYGRKFNQDRIRETIIKLPFKGGKIDWDFIENYIKGLPYSKYLVISR
jgi:hypothetical protein